MSKRRSFASNMEDAFYRMLDSGLFQGDNQQEEYEDEPEPTKAAKAVYTWLAIFLKNYRDAEVVVQNGGRMMRKEIVEVESEADIVRNIVEALELRFIGKPIEDDKAKKANIFED